MADSKFKVRLVSNGQDVVFEASSPVSESRSADYQGFDIVHLPTNLYAYRSTSGRHFSISGKLVSRTADEAQQNAKYVDLIRKWVLPDFGNTGATPPLVKLYAYGNNNINGVNCILRQYNFLYPDDVDYIFTSNPPMPVIMMIDIQLDEAYSAAEITSGAWKLKEAAGGGFVYGQGGGSYNWQTGGFGGQTQLPNVTQMMNSGFGGIASAEMLGGLQTVGGLMNSNPFNVSTGVGQAFGIQSSPGVVARTIGGAMSNLPFVTGVNPAAMMGGSLPTLNNITANVIANQTADLFGRDTGLTNRLPTFTSLLPFGF